MKNGKDKSESTMKYDEMISLMSVYLTDINFREESYWRQMFTYYYSTIVIICFPAIASMFNAEKIVMTIPSWIFYIVGIFMAFCFFYVSIAYTVRSRVLVDAYTKIIKDLPSKYQRDTLLDEYIDDKCKEKKYYKFFSFNMKLFISIIMLISQTALAVTLWIFL